MSPEDFRAELEAAISACDELIAQMQSGDEEAIDAARGLLWRWVDCGNATELINLLAAIRRLTQEALTELDKEENP